MEKEKIYEIILVTYLNWIFFAWKREIFAKF